MVEASCTAELPTALSKRQRKNNHQRAYRLRRLKWALSADEAKWLGNHERSGAERFGWHTLRHTFCTQLAMSETPIVKIQRWAGHADITTTQQCMHWARSDNNVLHIDELDSLGGKSSEASLYRDAEGPWKSSPKKTVSHGFLAVNTRVSR